MYAARIATAEIAMPMATYPAFKQESETISAPSAYPKGGRYFRKAAFFEILAIRFKKYIMAAIPRPMPTLPFLVKAEIPKQMAASSS